MTFNKMNQRYSKMAWLCNRNSSLLNTVLYRECNVKNIADSSISNSCSKENHLIEDHKISCHTGHQRSMYRKASKSNHCTLHLSTFVVTFIISVLMLLDLYTCHALSISEHQQQRTHLSQSTISIEEDVKRDMPDYNWQNDDDGSDLEMQIGSHWHFGGNEKNTSDVCLTDECITASGLLSSAIKFEVDPCQDFLKFACGHWVDEHPIPRYLHGWNQFLKLSYEIRKNLNDLLQSKELVSKNKIFSKLHDFYRGCINETMRNIAGYTALLGVLDELGGWPMLDGDDWNASNYHWEDSFIKLSKLNQNYIIGIEPMIDFRNTSKTIIKLGPPYKYQENIVNFQNYANDWKLAGSQINSKDANYASIDYRNLYKTILNELKVNSTLNNKLLDSDITAIFDLQENLQSMVSPMHSMQYYQTHYEEHLISIENIKQLIDFDLTYIVEQLFNTKLSEGEMVFVTDIDYIKNLGPFIKSIPKRDLANYFCTNMVYSLGRHTTTKMIELVLTKLDSSEVLPNICYEETAQNLPELLGKLYVDNYFDKGVINDVMIVASQLRESFRQLLSESQWMDKSTTEEALEKLDAMSINVAFPKWFSNQTKLANYIATFKNIDIEDYFSSVVNVNQARHSNIIRSFEERFDSSKPETLSWPGNNLIDVNAFYYFTTNGVYIPTGILQSPLYLKNVPGAVTFGSLGMIIGHEMTHAFDNSGRAYDKNGALRNWWSNKTLDLFTERADCFVNQYSSYTLDSIRIDGNNTLAENIADNGGLREAYRAFKTYESRLKTKDKPLPGIMSRFNFDQLFFISFANMWCSNVDQVSIKDDVENNPHSPSAIRVFGSLANFDKFSAAFNCSADSRMNPAKKCILW